MDRKRNIIIISGLIILFFLVALINLFYVNKSQEVYENEKSNNYISENILTMMYETAEGSGEYVVASDNRVISSNALTMMYETEAGSGEYQLSSDTTWPQEGYVFNERLSGCENGSSLTWDDERKAVILSTTVSDR